jgi:hypothetical protein
MRTTTERSLLRFTSQTIVAAVWYVVHTSQHTHHMIFFPLARKRCSVICSGVTLLGGADVILLRLVCMRACSTSYCALINSERFNMSYTYRCGTSVAASVFGLSQPTAVC